MTRSTGNRMRGAVDAAKKSGMMPFVLFGAFFWSWLDLSVFGTVLSGASGVSGEAAKLSSLVAYAASVVPLLVVFVVKCDFESFLKRPASAVAMGVLGAFGTVGLTVGGDALFVAVASAAQGLALGLFDLTVVVAIHRARGALAAGLTIAGSTLVGMVFDTAVLALRETLLIGAIAALPILCALGSYFAVNTQAPFSHPADDGCNAKCKAVESSGSRRGLRPYAVLFVFIVSFSFMHGYLQYFSAISSSWTSPDGAPLLIARFAAMGAIFALLCMRRIRIDIVLRAGIVVSLLGFTLISDSFFLPEIRGAGIYAAAAGYACFDVVTWGLLAETAFHAPKKGRRIITFGLFAWQLGTFFGASAGFAFEALALPEAVAGVAASTVALCIVGVGVYFLGSEFWVTVRYGSSLARADAAATAGLSLDEIAARHMLTKRESDVLGYLVKGRSVPYIAEAECISENTVRSHAKNIYVKFDVHTKQELIDAIENEKPPTRIM